MKLASLIIAFTPTVLFAIAASWHRRRRDRMAPVAIVLGTLWGAFLATSLTLAAGRYVETRLMLQLGHGPSGFGSVVLTPMVEEALKSLFLVVLLYRARVETALEGVYLGVATGLGFAATENFLAFAAAFRELGGEGWLSAVAFRTGVTGMMHATATATAGAIMGLCAGASQFTRWIVGPWCGFLAAMLVHTGFNGGVQAAAAAAPAAGQLLQGGLAVLVLIILFMVTRRARRSELRLLGQQLDLEAAAGHLAPTLLGRFAQTPSEVEPRTARLLRRLALLSLRETHLPARRRSERHRELVAVRQELETSKESRVSSSE